MGKVGIKKCKNGKINKKLIYAFELLLSDLITSGFPFSYQIRFTMAPHSTPTDKRAIADSLFAVKEQLPDGHYLALMNILDGKYEGPDITNAKLVEIHWDYIYTASPAQEICDWFPNSQIFHVLDEDRLAALVARDPKRAKCCVADICRSEDQPARMMESLVTSITADFLRDIHDTLTSDFGYTCYDGGVIRVRDIEVLATYD